MLLQWVLSQTLCVNSYLVNLAQEFHCLTEETEKKQMILWLVYHRQPSNYLFAKLYSTKFFEYHLGIVTWTILNVWNLSFNEGDETETLTWCQTIKYNTLKTTPVLCLVQRKVQVVHARQCSSTVVIAVALSNSEITIYLHVHVHTR